MLATIYLNDNMFFKADEIDDVISDRLLPAKSNALRS